MSGVVGVYDWNTEGGVKEGGSQSEQGNKQEKSDIKIKDVPRGHINVALYI